MKISRHLHQQIYLKNLLLTTLLLASIGTLAWLSQRYTLQTDITDNRANTLSSASQQLVRALQGPIQITAYLKKGQPVREQIAQLIGRYRRHKADITLNFIDPETQPEQTRELDIGSGGLILVDYQGRQEKIGYLDESALTNALLQLANAEERWVTFLAGHGERSPEGVANFDLSRFSKELARRKINTQTLNLATMPAIPDNSVLLVLSAPAVPLLPGELDLIRQYITKGGNLLVLGEPNNSHLQIVKELGLKQLPGTVVDSDAKLYGINDPSFVLVPSYPEHPVTQGFQTLTLFPGTAAYAPDEESDYQAEALFSSSEKSWTETGPFQGQIRFDADGSEKQGPLSLAYALTRELGNKTRQRLIVMGDGDFLANAYIGNVGNLDLGLRMVNWLIHEDRFINIPARKSVDSTLQLSKTAVAVMGFGFLLVLPCLLLGTGLMIWRKRKQR